MSHRHAGSLKSLRLEGKGIEYQGAREESAQDQSKQLSYPAFGHFSFPYLTAKFNHSAETDFVSIAMIGPVLR